MHMEQHKVIALALKIAQMGQKALEIAELCQEILQCKDNSQMKEHE